MILSLVLDLILGLIHQLFICTSAQHIFIQWIHESMKWPNKNLKNADHSYMEPKITPSDFFYGPTNGPKPKDSSFTIINDEKSSI